MRLHILLLITVLTCALSAVEFEWEDNGRPIIEGWNLNWQEQSVVTPDGGIVYAWRDTHEHQIKVYVHKIMPDGATPWGEPVAVSTLTGWQKDPVICAGNDNSILVAWLDYANDENGDVQAQKVDANGQLLWSNEGTMVTNAAGIQRRLTINSDGNGGAYITWDDLGNTEMKYNRIYSEGTAQFGQQGEALFEGYSYQYEDIFVCSDDSGGILALMYAAMPDNCDSLVATHLGDTCWDATISNVSSNKRNAVASIAPDGDYRIAWVDERNEWRGDVFAQRISSTGQVMWNDDCEVCLAAQEQDNLDIAVNSVNETFVVWEDKRDSGVRTDVYVQKLSSAGLPLWSSDGVSVIIDSVYQSDPELAAGTNGDVYVLWEDSIVACQNNPLDLYWQHILSNGELEWDVNGVPIVDAPNMQHESKISWQGDNLLISWADLTLGEELRLESPGRATKIRHQLYDTAGQALLEPEGVIVVEGGSNGVGHFLVTENSDATYILYKYHFEDTEQIRAQKILSDGSIQWGEWGILLVEEEGLNLECASPHHEGGVAFAVHFDVNDYEKAFAYAIDSNGNMLWGDEGVALGIQENDQDLIKMDKWNEDYVFAWRQEQYDNRFWMMTYAQKINDGCICWGDSGASVLSENAGEATIVAVTDHYIVSLKDHLLRVSLLEDDGSPSPAFNPPLTVGQTTYDNYAATANYYGDLLIIWEEAADPFDETRDLYAQMITPQGQKLFGEGGVLLVQNAYEQSKQKIAIDDDRFYVIWCDYVDDQNNILLKAFSWNGQPIWSGGALRLSRQIRESSQPEIRLTDFGVLCFWTDDLDLDPYYTNFDLMMQLVLPNGEIVWDEDGVVLCGFGRSIFSLTPVMRDNNFVEMYWADYRNGIASLYAQRMDIPLNPTGEDSAPVPALRLTQNAPNPFNPDTTIRFSLPSGGETTLAVYNIRGQKVRTLVNDRLEAGDHANTWDGRDANGAVMSSGVYLYRLESAGGVETRRMVLLK